MIELSAVMVLPLPDRPCMCAESPFARAYKGAIFVVTMRMGPGGCFPISGEWRTCPTCEEKGCPT